MVTTTGELRTYYQRNWEEILPTILPKSWDSARLVAGLTLSFVGLLYKPAGKVISFGSTFLNVLSTGAVLRNAEKWKPVHVWSVIKSGAEFIGTIASLRIGLAVHTVMNLGEKSYKLVIKFKESTWSQTGQRMLPVVSNALYLLTLASFSGHFHNLHIRHLRSGAQAA